MRKILRASIWIVIILMINGCSHKSVSQLKLTKFPTGKTEAFSGLFYDGINSDGELIFWTHSDRGPNADSFQDKNTGLIHRPFVEPAYRLRWIKFSYNPKTNQIQYKEEIGLTLPNGRAITGLPNLPAKKNRTGDETPVTLKNIKLAFDPMGIDPEGLCKQGSYFWMVEEYGPSILKFDHKGRLVKRYVPKGYLGKQSKILREVLPENLMRRKLNRGFEGIACSQDKIYAGLQSPLAEDGNKTIIVEFDPEKEVVNKVFYYPLDKTADKIGDMVFKGDRLLVLEQNSEVGPESFHKVFEVDVSKPEKLLRKTLLMDLVKIGYDFADKVEGLAITENDTLFFVNDNDFGLAGPIDERTKKAILDPSKESVLGHIEL